jgi:hypothetical protein
MEVLANIDRMWLGEEVGGEMMAVRLEVIYQFKSILISQILFEKFKLQFNFVLAVVSSLIIRLIKELNLIIWHVGSSWYETQDFFRMFSQNYTQLIFSKAKLSNQVSGIKIRRFNTTNTKEPPLDTILSQFDRSFSLQYTPLQILRNVILPSPPYPIASP